MKSGKMTKSPKFFFVFKATTSALEVKLLVLVNLALMFAAHKEKSFVSAFFKVSVDHLFDNLESRKSYCFGNVLKFGSNNLYKPNFLMYFGQNAARISNFLLVKFPPSTQHKLHGSYNLEKVLNFTSRLEKSLNSVQVLEKQLISLIGVEKYLKFTTLSTPDTLFCKMQLLSRGKCGSSSV